VKYSLVDQINKNSHCFFVYKSFINLKKSFLFLDGQSIKKNLRKKGLKIAPLGETLPKKHHNYLTLEDAKHNKLNN